jgi:hypothetical protein
MSVNFLTTTEDNYISSNEKRNQGISVMKNARQFTSQTYEMIDDKMLHVTK